MNRLALVLVAGGSGKRMNTALPKQFLLLANRPILMRSLERFHAVLPKAQKVVVLPKDQISYWQELCRLHNCAVPHELAEGGKERFHSVKNGLEKLRSCDFVAVHDGVRPMVSEELILRAFADVSKETGVVPGIDLKDSIRSTNGDLSKAEDRSKFKIIQTPQVFAFEELKSAFSQEYKSSFTDEASVWEAAGGQIKIVAGEEENFKITRPIDLSIAEAQLKNHGINP